MTTYHDDVDDLDGGDGSELFSLLFPSPFFPLPVDPWGVDFLISF